MESKHSLDEVEEILGHTNHFLKIVIQKKCDAKGEKEKLNPNPITIIFVTSVKCLMFSEGRRYS